MKINARVELSDEEINNIIVGAIESGTAGIGYWASVGVYRPKDNYAKIMDWSGWNESTHQDKNDFVYEIDAKVIRKGVNKIISDPRLQIRSDIRNSIMTDNMDAECYDCIVQVGLFGEILYI